MLVKTGSVRGRRTLHFDNYQELFNEVDHLAAGNCTTLGNWSLGQICQHLANAMNMSIDGAPFPAPLLFRLLGPLLKQRVLNRPMQSGFQLPPAAAQLLPGETDTADGVAALQAAITRMNREPQRKPHPVFGPLTREQWDQLHLRHAEMHVSFVVPKPK